MPFTKETRADVAAALKYLQENDLHNPATLRQFFNAYKEFTSATDKPAKLEELQQKNPQFFDFLTTVIYPPIHERLEKQGNLREWPELVLKAIRLTIYISYLKLGFQTTDPRVAEIDKLVQQQDRDVIEDVRKEFIPLMDKPKTIAARAVTELKKNSQLLGSGGYNEVSSASSNIHLKQKDSSRFPNLFKRSKTKPHDAASSSQSLQLAVITPRKYDPEKIAKNQNALKLLAYHGLQHSPFLATPLAHDEKGIRYSTRATHDLIYELNEKQPSFLQRINLMAQIIAAVGALHAKDIVHRDIKPGNILIYPDGRAALGDLDTLTPVINEQGHKGSINPETGEPLNKYEYDKAGTPDFAAPEFYNKSTKEIVAEEKDRTLNRPKIDVFALGVTLAVTCEDKLGIDFGDDNIRTINDLRKAGTIYDNIASASKKRVVALNGRDQNAVKLAELITSMTHLDPKQRPNMEQVKTKYAIIAAALNKNNTNIDTYFDNLHAKYAKQSQLESAEGYYLTPTDGTNDQFNFSPIQKIHHQVEIVSNQLAAFDDPTQWKSAQDRLLAAKSIQRHLNDLVVTITEKLKSRLSINDQSDLIELRNDVIAKQKKLTEESTDVQSEAAKESQPSPTLEEARKSPDYAIHLKSVSAAIQGKRGQSVTYVLSELYRINPQGLKEALQAINKPPHSASFFSGRRKGNTQTQLHDLINLLDQPDKNRSAISEKLRTLLSSSPNNVKEVLLENAKRTLQSSIETQLETFNTPSVIENKPAPPPDARPK